MGDQEIEQAMWKRNKRTAGATETIGATQLQATEQTKAQQGSSLTSVPQATTSSGAVEQDGAPGTTATKKTVSAVIVTCDDAQILEACLQSVARWVDDIVVVDMHSTDGTREIVRRYTDRLYDHERLTYADPMRNYALGLAKGDWTVLIDPDERVPEPLAREFVGIVQQDAVDVVMVPFCTVMFGRPLESPGGRDIAHPRLFRTGVYKQPGPVHTSPDFTGKEILHLPERGPDYAIQHDTWRSVPQVVDKLMRYAPFDMQKLQEQEVVFSPAKMWRAAGDELFGRIFQGRAYEDGIPGILSALYFTFYKLSIWALLWEAEGRPSRFDRRVRRTGQRLRRPVWFAYRVVRKVFLSRNK